MNDDQQRLARSLQERAERIGDASPVGLDDVRRTARGLQRRRRAMTGLVAAAVVAAVVPIGLGLGGDDRSAGPIPPAGSPSVLPSTSKVPSVSPSPSSPTPTSASSSPATPSTLTATGAGRSYPPRVTYVAGRDVHVDGGAATTLPGSYISLTPYRGGWLAVERRQEDTYVVELDASLKEVSARRGGERIAISSDGTQVAWFLAASGGQPARLVEGLPNGHSEGEATVDLPGVQTATPVGFLGTMLVYQVEDTQQTWVTDFSGKGNRVPARGGLLKAGAVNSADQTVGIQTAYEDGRACWAVMANSGPRTAEQCHHTLVDFSPDGRHVVGFPSYTDGLGSSELSIMDASTGDVVRSFQRPENGSLGFVSDVVWEDDEHVLATAYDQDQWWVLRLGVDGSHTVAAGPVKGPAEESPYHFAAQP